MQERERLRADQGENHVPLTYINPAPKRRKKQRAARAKKRWGRYGSLSGAARDGAQEPQNQKRKKKGEKIYCGARPATAGSPSARGARAARSRPRCVDCARGHGTARRSGGATRPARSTSR